jgi:hypothetical protein
MEVRLLIGAELSQCIGSWEVGLGAAVHGRRGSARWTGSCYDGCNVLMALDGSIGG